MTVHPTQAKYTIKHDHDKQSNQASYVVEPRDLFIHKRNKKRDFYLNI